MNNNLQDCLSIEFIQVSAHLEWILLQVLQVLFLSIGLNLVNSLHCLSLDLRAFPLDLDVRHLDDLLIGIG